MKIIESKIDKELPFKDPILGENPCFLDIETTGLSRYTDLIYLIGILYYDNQKRSWILKQFFMDELEDEKKLLCNVMDFISDFDIIINYNGDSFDIPFINYRLDFYGLNSNIPIEKSLDLYSIIRKNRYLFDLPNLKLKTIENFLGIQREDTFSGRDCINFYRQYLIDRNPVSEERILKHNYEDLYYLMDIITILNMIKVKKSFVVHHGKEDLVFSIDNIRIINDFLFIKGTIDGSILNGAIHYGDNYRILISKERLFEISIEIKRGLITPEKECLFINREEYMIDDCETWESNYTTPSNIILLEVDGRYEMNNIKNLILNLLSRFI